MSFGNKLMSRFRNAWSRFQRSPSPRETQEQKDLYHAILSSTYRKLRYERFAPHLLSSSSSPPAHLPPQNEHRHDRRRRRKSGCIGTLSSPSKNREVLEGLIEEASESLETDMGIHNLSNKTLRWELHNMLGGEWVESFRAFEKVDRLLFKGDGGVGGEERDYGAVDDDVHRLCRDVLEKEHSDIVQDILRKEESGEESTARTRSSLGRMRHALYLAKKKSAIETIFHFKGWSIPTNEHTSSPSPSPSPKPSAQPTPSNDGSDEFGYHLSSSPSTNEGIRYHQMLNLTRSVLLRDNHLGYAILALKSTIPPRRLPASTAPITAGRGIFLDGFVPAGSTLALFPGQIWPKEHLLPLHQSSNDATTTTAQEQHQLVSFFQNDPKHLLSLRTDGILIDSRSSPYTVLEPPGSNPFAIAHVANHPPPGVEPNCVTVPVDFTEGIMSPSSLMSFVPNSYAKPPGALGPGLLEREVVVMRGFGLVAQRDIEDEELFYDYRLSPGGKDGEGRGGYPDWYRVVDEEALRNRWGK